MLLHTSGSQVWVSVEIRSAGLLLKTRSGALLEMIRTAASADPDIADLWAGIERKLLDVQRSIIEQLNASGSLAPSLNAPRAADIPWTLNHPNVWQLLVPNRGWTDEEYERWLGDAFCFQLLGSPTGPHDETHPRPLEACGR